MGKRIIVLNKPEFSKLISSVIDLEFCLCIYDVSSEKEMRREENLNYTLEKMDHHRLQECDYDKDIMKLIPPLDRNVIDFMRIYESEIISIIYRWSNISYLQARKHYYNHLKFWFWYLREKRIDSFIGMIPHESYYSVIYYLCKFMNIQTILLCPLSIKDCFTLIEDWRKPYLYLEGRESDSNESLGLSKAFNDFVNDLDKSKYPWYMIEPALNLNKNKLAITLGRILSKNKKSIKLLESILTSRYNESLSFIGNKYTKDFKDYLIDFVFDTYYESVCNISCSDFIIGEEERYIYLPLHYQPECTTLPLGDFFEDQELIIEWLSSFLNNSTWLYVKEHPLQTYEINNSRYRCIEFYKRILELPRVKLISRRYNSYDLIKNSICVATVTGTVTMEALYYEKPVLFFGYHVYQCAPGVYTIRSLEDCEKALKNIWEGKTSFKRSDFLKYLRHLENNSICLDIENEFSGSSYIEDFLGKIKRFLSEV